MINVIGMGYIGLPTALALSAHGNTVVGTDYNAELIQKLQNHELTFEEKGLDFLFEEALSQGVTFTNQYEETDCYIVTVPTPYHEASKKLDPVYVVSAVASILKVCKSETILIIESTVYPGMIDKYIRPLIAEINKTIHLVHAPERILPGNMIKELRHNSRTIGADSMEIANHVKKIYGSFCEGKIICTDIQTAEMTKVVENSYRAVNIAFANELLKLANASNLDIAKIIEIANMHPRVNILSPGPGVGGHCIPIDPWFLVGEYPQATPLLSTALEINASMPELVLKRIKELANKFKITDLDKIGIYGLTYKPDVDDIRESPSLQLFRLMEEHFATPFKVYDPMVHNQLLPNQVLNFETFINSTELIVVMVGHSHLQKNLQALDGKRILDTRNVVENAYKL